MFPRVAAAYQKLGYRLHLGNPSCLVSEVQPINSRKRLMSGGGMSVSDGFLFAALARALRPSAIFCVGNACGISTLTLAELFPEAKIDAIDAEAEGADNALGSQITRQIAAESFPNVQLTIGYSPQDVPKAARTAAYQLGFIDGLHTNEQMLADFKAILPLLDQSSVVVFHDVAIEQMMAGWASVLSIAEPQNFKGYPMGFTSCGTCVLVRGLAEVEAYLAIVAEDFGDHPYRVGFSYYNPQRPRLFNTTLSQIERAVKIGVRKLFSGSNGR